MDLFNDFVPLGFTLIRTGKKTLRLRYDGEVPAEDLSATYEVTYDKPAPRELACNVVGVEVREPTVIDVRDSGRYERCATVEVSSPLDAPPPPIGKYIELFGLPGVCQCGKAGDGSCFIYLHFDKIWKLSYGKLGDPCLSVPLEGADLGSVIADFRDHGANVPEPAEMREAVWKIVLKLVFFLPGSSVVANGVFEKSSVLSQGSSLMRRLLNELLFNYGGSHATNLEELRACFDKMSIVKYAAGWYGSYHRPLPRIEVGLELVNRIYHARRIRLTWVIPDPRVLSRATYCLYAMGCTYSVVPRREGSSPIILPLFRGGHAMSSGLEDYPAGFPELALDACPSNVSIGPRLMPPHCVMGCQHAFLLDKGEVVARRKAFVTLKDRAFRISSWDEVVWTRHKETTQYLKSVLHIVDQTGWLMIGLPAEFSVDELMVTRGKRYPVPTEGYFVDGRKNLVEIIPPTGVIGFYDYDAAVPTSLHSVIHCLCGQTSNHPLVQDFRTNRLLQVIAERKALAVYSSACPHVRYLGVQGAMRDEVSYLYNDVAEYSSHAYHGNSVECDLGSVPLNFPMVVLSRSEGEGGFRDGRGKGPEYCWFYDDDIRGVTSEADAPTVREEKSGPVSIMSEISYDSDRTPGFYISHF